MSDVKWIKITTEMFDNKKIKHIRKLPEGNNIVLIWIMLLTMAGRCNSSGFIFLTENIPYTPKMLADELGFDENVIQIALNALETFNMIHRDGNLLSIPGWEEHQNIDGMEKIRQQTNKRVAKYRERQKEQAKLLGCNVTETLQKRCGNADVTQQNKNIERDKELDIDTEKDKDINKDKECFKDENKQHKANTTKNKKKEEKDTKEILDEVLKEYPVSDCLLEAINDWLDYKKHDKKFVYLEKSLKSLVKKLFNCAKEYGDEAVVDVITVSMANGYQGIVFDRLNQYVKKNSQSKIEDFSEFINKE